MHISVKEQTRDGKPAIMCIEREIRVCIILHADLEKVDTLNTLANAVGVTSVLILAKTQDVPTLESTGWHVPKGLTLLIKEKS